jgi:hypothetical protein
LGRFLGLAIDIGVLSDIDPPEAVSKVDAALRAALDRKKKC